MAPSTDLCHSDLFMPGVSSRPRGPTDHDGANLFQLGARNNTRISARCGLYCLMTKSSGEISLEIRVYRDFPAYTVRCNRQGGSARYK
jgi:hypothetical protein